MASNNSGRSKKNISWYFPVLLLLLIAVFFFWRTSLSVDSQIIVTNKALKYFPVFALRLIQYDKDGIDINKIDSLAKTNFKESAEWIQTLQNDKIFTLEDFRKLGYYKMENKIIIYITCYDFDSSDNSPKLKGLLLYRMTLLDGEIVEEKVWGSLDI